MTAAAVGAYVLGAVVGIVLAELVMHVFGLFGK